MMDEIQKRLLAEVADLHGVPEGAYNIRANGQMAARNTTANIDIVSKTDVSGIDIYIKPGTVNESVHIPVVLSQSGMKEMVYNDFHIGEGSDVVIVAGCGIDNCGDQDAEHDGIHRFFIEKNAKVKYVEKHYGAGDGKGKRILNPGTEVYMEEGTLTVELLGRGMAWLDTGTHTSMLKASNFVEAVQTTQGTFVACLEEIAYRQGWISTEQVKELAKPLMKTEYGKYLVDIVEEVESKA